MNLSLLCLIRSVRLEKWQIEPCRELRVSRDQFRWGELELRNAQSSSTLSLLHLGAETHHGSLGDVLWAVGRDMGRSPRGSA